MASYIIGGAAVYGVYRIYNDYIKGGNTEEENRQNEAVNAHMQYIEEQRRQAEAREKERFRQEEEARELEFKREQAKKRRNLMKYHQRELSEKIDINKKMYHHMRQREIISADVDVDKLRDPSASKNEIRGILDDILSRSDEQINQFCECLEESNQAPIVKEYLSLSSEY